MEIKRSNILSLSIDNESDIGICRRKTMNLATQIGFDKIKVGEIAILVSELVTNVIKHGGGIGKFIACEIEDKYNKKALEVWCCDSGNGISDYENAVKDGVTQKKSLGLGLGTINRFSDQFEINPDIDQTFLKSYFEGNANIKHCLRSVRWVPSKNWIGLNPNLITGAASRCHPAEVLNGDAYLINQVDINTTVVSVIDGLGHGKEANHASEKAKEQIIVKADLPLDNLMKHVHNSIRGTRGATIGIAIINTERKKLFFSGIGNIETFLITKEGKKTLLSFGGIMGHNMRTPRVFEHDFLPGDTLCMYSDGITTRWRHEDINWNDPPQKNAEHIINNFSRLNDDATILIIRNS